MSTRESIIRMMYAHNIKQSDIAWAVGLSEQTLSYQLNVSKKFDVELSGKIIDYINTRFNQGMGEAKMVNSLFLEITNIAATSLAALSVEIKKSLADDNLTDVEKNKLKNRIDDLKENLIPVLDAFRELIK